MPWVDLEVNAARCVATSAEKPRFLAKLNMSIHFVTGRPGAGKSFYSMKLIVEELRGTPRKLVTNLAIIQKELGFYLHKEYGETFDLLDRLHIIEDDQIEYFYCHRGPRIEPLPLSYDAKKRPESFDIAQAQAGGGVFYILDEVHLAFGARNWQNMGQACTYYASQHRKLGDDVILITQAPKMVDTTFRNLAQDYTVLRNHAMEKIMFFKQPDVFTRQTFLNLPQGNEKPMEKSVFKLDLKVANCYDTSQGVGIHTRGKADVGSDNRKGLSWKWGVAAFIIGIILLAQIPIRCGSYISDKVVSAPVQVDNNESKGSITGLFTAKKKKKDVDKNATKPTVPVVGVATIVDNPVVKEEFSRVKVTGYLTKETEQGEWEFRAYLGNGEQLSLVKGDIINISNTYVEDVAGNKYLFERPVNVLKLRGAER